MNPDYGCHLALSDLEAGNAAGRSLCSTSAIPVGGISCFAAQSWYISYFMGGASCGNSDGCAYCGRCLPLFKQDKTQTISAMSKTPPTTASIATFAPVERPDQNVVFAFGLADVVEEETVEDEIVDPILWTTAS
jgi:hypothetical protein